ncbi:MAG: sterol desaturase family protein [Bacteroidetes bacterium]|nr:sterol desaturase family protein [Bacteroidota bacterium]MBS1932663.1 sterol desaturase family protein [Bacteroidota bacterium]
MLNIFTDLYNQVIGFLGIGHWIEMYKSGDYSSLNTLDGIEGAIGPLIPLLLILEIIRAALYKKFKVLEYKTQFFTYVFNSFIGQFISLVIIARFIDFFEKHSLFKTTFAWYWLIYGYIVWEFSHFIYHYLAHKVRLLWCLHSTHHSPTSMNLAVTYAHFFFEAPYANIIRNSICLFMGVNPLMLGLIMFIDGTWGAFIHVGENLMKDGRLGFLNKIILTPSHHRVHHARNPLYMDTNFCNLLNIWDKVFGTYVEEKREIPIEYGITREMNPSSFLDAYFGEIAALAKDVKRAPGIKNKFLYLVMPPGWSHTGNHKTAKVVRDEYLKNLDQTAKPVQA